MSDGQPLESPLATCSFPDGPSDTTQDELFTCSRDQDHVTALTEEQIEDPECPVFTLIVEEKHTSTDNKEQDLTSNVNKTGGTYLGYVPNSPTTSEDCTIINQSCDLTNIFPDATGSTSLDQVITSGTDFEERPLIKIMTGACAQRDGLNDSESTATPVGLESPPDTAAKPEMTTNPTSMDVSGLEPLSPVSPVQKSLPPSSLLQGEKTLEEMRESMTEIRQIHPVQLSCKKPTEIGNNFPKKLLISWKPRVSSEPKGDFLEQLSQFFSLDGAKGYNKRDLKKDTDATFQGAGTTGEDRKSTAKPVDSHKVTSEALDAFKAFFTLKDLKKDGADHAGLDAMRNKMKTDMEKLRSLFEKPSVRTTTADSKSPSDSESVVTSSQGNTKEQNTPGRLQAVWPPPKSKDEDVRLGLKYTEAEHQTALLKLKRDCKDEMEKMRTDFELQISQLLKEHAASVSQLEETIKRMQTGPDTNVRKHRQVRDIGVSTRGTFQPKNFHHVWIQTEQEHFTTNPGDGHQSPQKLNLTSISEGLLGKDEYTLELPSPWSSMSFSQQELLNSIKPTLLLSTPPSAPSPRACPSTTLDENHPSSFHFPPPPAPPLLALGSGPCLSVPKLPGAPPPVPLPSQGLASSLPMPTPPGADHVSNHIVKYASRKPVVEPALPMKPLFWTRIQVQDNKDNTLWNSLEEPQILNTKEFEDLFSKAILQPKKNPLSCSYEKSFKVKKTVKLLQDSRSQAVGILMSSLHLEMKDIGRAVLMLDDSVVDIGTIEALYEIRAQNDELEKIREHFQPCKEDDRRLLDKPEQFLYELSQIPDFSVRASCMIFQSTFFEVATSVRCKVDAISCVCKDLLERDSVKEIMGLVLAFGNYMNAGNRHRGQADGFGLEILPRLKDIKSKDKSISLVDYIISYYLRNCNKKAAVDSTVFPLPEPRDFLLASQVTFSEVVSNLRMLKQKLIACEKDFQKVCLNSLVEHLQPFKDKMEAFILKAKTEHDELDSCLTSAQQSFQDMATYFDLKTTLGEKDVTPSSVFKLWFEFSNDFKIAWEQEKKHISLDKFKETVRKMTVEKKVETRMVTPSSLKERLRQKEAKMSWK